MDPELIEKIAETILSGTNTQRKIAEMALNSIIIENSLDFFQGLTRLIKKTRSLEIQDFSYLLIKNLFETKKISFETVPQILKSGLFQYLFDDFHKNSLSSSACLCFAILIKNEISLSKNYSILDILTNFSKFKEINTLKNSVLILGFFCENINALENSFISAIFEVFVQGLCLYETKHSSLQGLQRGMHLFKCYIDKHLMSNVIKASYIDASVSIKLLALEAYLEYVCEFTDTVIDTDFLLKVLQVEGNTCKLMALEIICVANLTNDFRIISETLRISIEDDLHSSCLQYLKTVFHNNENLQLLNSFIFIPNDPYTLHKFLSITACIPRTTNLSEFHLNTILTNLTNSDAKIQELSSLALSNIVNENRFQANSNETILLLLDIIFSTSDQNECNTKVYCCWSLLEFAKFSLSQAQIIFLIDRLIFVEGNSELVYAVWAVINELIEKLEKVNCVNIFHRILGMLQKENAEKNLECIFSAISVCVSMMIKLNVQIKEKESNFLINKILTINCEENSPYELIVVMSTCLGNDFEKYICRIMPFLIKNLRNKIGLETITHLLNNFIICRCYTPLLTQKIGKILDQNCLNEENEKNFNNFLFNLNNLSCYS